jgi:hypothetical protein
MTDQDAAFVAVCRDAPAVAQRMLELEEEVAELKWTIYKLEK